MSLKEYITKERYKNIPEQLIYYGTFLLADKNTIKVKTPVTAHKDLHIGLWDKEDAPFIKTSPIMLPVSASHLLQTPQYDPDHYSGS